jgi:hypothetical protein
MTYAPVIPSTWDPLRQSLNNFLEAIIASFQAAVPGVIRRQWTEVPATFAGEVPLIYFGDITETLTHDMGLRRTVFTGQIGYVDVAPDNQEANTRANSFADYMREVFTANPRISVGATGTGGIDGILQQTGLTEGPAPADGPPRGWMHLVLDYTFVVLEGRN